MAKTTFLTFYIVLTDADDVAALQAQYPNGVNRAPYNAGPPAGGAAIEFAAPWTDWNNVGAAPQAPYTWSPWANRIDASGSPYPINVAKFTRHTGGFWGIGGTTTTYYWVGQFVYAGSNATPIGTAGAPATAPELEYAPISLRRWIDGFEVPHAGPAALTGIGGGYNSVSDAARHVGGRGLALRGPNNNNVVIAPNKYRAVTTANGWDRVYVRLRKLPTGGSINFWTTRANPTASNGVALDINTSGQITVYSTASAGRSVLGAIDPPLPVWTGLSSDDAWRRLDLLYEYAAGGANGYFRIFVDGALAASFTIASASGGLGSGTTLQSVVVGENNSVGANTLELDLDDLVSAELPPGQDSLATNGSGRPYIYDSNALYVVGDLVHTADGHAYKCIKNIASAVQPDDGTVIPSPTRGGTFWHRYEGRDWLYGSRILLSKPKAFGANHSVNWTGNYRTLQANGFFHQLTTGPALTSSTASAVAEAEMDVAEQIDTEPNTVGAVSVLVTTNSFRGANSGSLGYNINAAGAVDTAIVEAATPGGYNAVLYPGPVSAALVDVSPLQTRYTKGAGADAAAMRSLLAQVELLGTFDRHDFRPSPDGGAWASTQAYAVGDVVERKHVWYQASSAAGAGLDPASPAGASAWTAITLPAFPAYVGQHNAPYRRSEYVLGAKAAPNAPFIVQGGTYTGNATGQDLAVFRAPIGLLFIRPLTGGAGGYVWWPGMHAGHAVFAQSTMPSLTDAAEDLTFVETGGEDVQQRRYALRLSGAHTQVNANAVTYQYIAVMDPGARFMLNHDVVHNHGLTADADNPLIDPAFLADWLFALVESLDATATVRFYGKGPGNAAQTIAKYDAAAVTTALAIATGKLTTKSAFHALGNTGVFAFNLWRRADGNNDPGQNAVVNIVTWVGDGSASRTINLAPASGKRPLFAIAFSEAATGFWRDPSHTGSNSTNSAGADLTTGITGGGIDSISVGSALNTNNVIYHLFVLFAGTTAGNNGWGVNGEYFPVEASPPATGPWPADPDPDDFEPAPEPEPEPLPGEPDLDPDTPLPGTDLFCVDFTQKLANQALSRIGVNKRIKDLANETTLEADTVRLHIKQDVEATLRRFPWPFATGYADLALVDGAADDPVNQDWTYSYRAPADMVAARRLVNQAGLKRTADPLPPEFRLGGDTNGALIYADADILSENLQLEYTLRNRCPAYFGDAVFRDALIWRIAASCAPSLSRDAKMAGYCLEMFEAIFSKATTIAANESQPTNLAGDAPWIVDRD